MKMRKGQSLIEYALILSLVTIIAITALQLLGSRVDQAVRNVGNNIDAGTANAGETWCAAQGGKTYNATANICE